MPFQSDGGAAFPQEWWRVALTSIGDGVIVTDAHGRVAFLNSVAESLTGWTQTEAEARPLEEVFVIANEVTRATVENPIVKVLKTGYVVGLANHTVLISRHGRQIPIDDSAAPIRDDKGNVVGAVLIFRDITERRRTEMVQSYLAAIVEFSDDAIVGKTLEGVITSWNKGAEKMFGYTAEEAIGRSITIIIPPELIGEEAQVLERLKQGERIDHYETTRIRKDGSKITVSLTVSPIENPTGKIIGASKIARDITARKQSEEEREHLLAREYEARAKAEEASRLKDEFLATLSHELRTPLNAILGWATLLRTGSLERKQVQHALETIERNAKTQAELIEDLLDVSRIITGQLRLDVRPVMAAPVVESAVASVMPAAEAKGIRLQTMLDPNAGPVAADSGRLQQVLWNLLSNAIKFTPRGGSVQVRVERINSHIEIIVSDTGQGIRREFLPYVFDRFRQADAGTTRQNTGLGLGLAIVRHLVELHGGSITADSPGEGHGATFAVRLPVMAVHWRKDEERTHPKAGTSRTLVLDRPPNLKDIKVLLIDDEADTRRLLRTVLEHCGAEVRDAGSAEEGLAQVKSWKPSIVISDIGMPAHDGYQLIQLLRDWERGSGTWIPAVALTAYARAEDRLRALAAGYQIHVAKPIDPVELAFVVAGQLGRGT